MDKLRENEIAKLERRKSRKAFLLDKELVRVAVKQAFVMLKPWIMARNPVMFVTEMGAVLTTLELAMDVVGNRESFIYTFSVALILWVTVLFANFAEGLAEARGKAQAETLKKTRRQTIARRVINGKEEKVPSDKLQEGDIVCVSIGEIIPGDGEIIEGAAMVDESAITGESAPVVREAGGDRSGVTGGTRVLSDQIRVRITAGAGNSFLDRMISLVEGAVRQKTPNELALTVTLAGLTLAFLMVTGALWPIGLYFGVKIPIPTLIALLVCLIPTTIGALLSAIGLAGMDRALSANVLAKSGKAVELAGDIDTILLDKTGTITMGNRQASEFYPLPGVARERLAEASMRASIGDRTPEGKSIVKLSQKTLGITSPYEALESEIIQFSAQTRLSGLNTVNGRHYRKGASDAIRGYIKENGGAIPEALQGIVNSIGREGSTPIVIVEENEALGSIALSDMLKPGIRDRFERLRAMGLRVVMATGDNPLTASAIAGQAGRMADMDYIARAITS